MCDAEGCLFIKPCVQAEIDFYEQVFDGSHPALADLVPLFMGSLMLNERAETAVEAAVEAATDAAAERPPQQAADDSVPSQDDDDDNVRWVPRGSQSIETDRAVVLDNATYGYKQPNVLDVKLGRRLWGDSAPLQKRRRMDEVSTETTHATHGFRIAGMRVYQGDGDYRVYDKDYGRKKVNDDNVVDAFRHFLCNPAAGVDAAHSRALAQAFKTDLERVRDVLERERTRMYSTSLLFVYEGDGAALRAAVAQGNAQVEASEDKEACRESAAAAAGGDEETALRARSRRGVLGKATADRSSSRTDSGIVMDDEDTDDIAELEADTDADADADAAIDLALDLEGDGSDSDDGASSMPHIYGLRLIDFAHAKFVPTSDGPDENNLAGVRRLIEIFEELAV